MTLSRPARPSVRLAPCVRRTAACFSHATSIGPRFQPTLLRTGRYRPRLFIWKTQQFRSKPGPFFAKYPGYFDNCTPDHFSEKFRIFRRQHFPKYLEYFGKPVPEIFGIFRENGGWLRFSRNIWNISGNWSLQKMKPLHLPDYGRGSPDRFG